MRVTVSRDGFRARAIAGTNTVMIALDCDEPLRQGLLGFGFRRELPDGSGKWLRSQKVFKSQIPDPRKAVDDGKVITTEEHPIQSYVWSDYGATPDTKYRFKIVPMYGQPGALQPRAALEIDITTEKEFDGHHGVWFNRGAIASQAFTKRFKNKKPEDPEDPNDEETKWLSRGLLEACLDFIDSTPAADALRVCAYEFSYVPVLAALKNALDRGVDVQIIHHGKESYDKAAAKAGIPKTKNGKKVIFRRTKPKIPHNKFIIRLTGGTKPTEVWTGSTNFTPSGFLGQTNVGHRIKDADTARQYLAYWKVLSKDPDKAAARTAVMELTPDPPALPAANSISRLFSPRPKATLLNWYGDRIGDATNSVMFTAAFTINPVLMAPLARDRDFLRFVLKEKPPSTDEAKALKADRDLVISYGAVLGKMYTFKNGKAVARIPIKEFDLEKWFLEEDLFRAPNEGNIFFVHTKFLLIDPLSDDPLVCSGSANFSSNSLLENDENMLLIRGDTRVADIYMTEFDRIFRHFYFRDVANQIEIKGGAAEGAFLAEDSSWTDSYFWPGGFKTRRREMFFAKPAKNWTDNAGQPKPATPSAKPAAKKKAAKKKAAKKKVTKKKAAKKKKR
jgi:phosphatidylserine/phosphatidylglycerophosphate/cardiolipin synthase-like enzyme